MNTTDIAYGTPVVWARDGERIPCFYLRGPRGVGGLCLVRAPFGVRHVHPDKLEVVT